MKPLKQVFKHKLHLPSTARFTFTPSSDTIIRGGNTALVDKLPFDPATIKSWKLRSLMFKDQLVNLEGLYVKEWKDINRNLLNRSEKLPGRQPYWYQKYIDTNTISLNKKLLSPIQITVSHLPSHKPQKYPPISTTVPPMNGPLIGTHLLLRQFLVKL
ncbi:hypothetical protein C1645_828598 [Glomus cerebriforme]|uniref:Uncharacterized protein n=1 Tax=Glomus cerebriforme TaxID=658196 RepID=A0A397SLJ2_9GLOM|nr:hypothetical protein C1645_828598 [Glomus cerebriforme]